MFLSPSSPVSGYLHWYTPTYPHYLADHMRLNDCSDVLGLSLQNDVVKRERCSGALFRAHHEQDLFPV